MLQAEAESVVDLLRTQRIFAHVYRPGVGPSCGVRVVLSDGREALWDADGAAGLEAQVMRDGMLVGFVPVISGSADFSIEQTVAAIAAAEYGDN